VENLEQNERELEEAGANLTSTTLLDTVRNLHAWLPVLEQPAATAAVDSKMAAAGKEK
jgi:hypothetical protein